MTQGFEFAYMLDGSNARPVTRDFTLGASADHLIGDLMKIQSDDGYVDAVTGTTTEVTGVMQEYLASASVTASSTLGKMAIITVNQVWRCSMDASTATTALVGLKALDTLDKNTVSATDITNGAMVLLDKSETDGDGNLIAYVVFSNTTFGNVA